MSDKKIYQVRGGCVLCCTCETLCPVEAIHIDADGAHIDPELCIGCGKCAANCPGEAIEPVETDRDKKGTQQ
jgi:ferredoxin